MLIFLRMIDYPSRIRYPGWRFRVKDKKRAGSRTGGTPLIMGAVNADVGLFDHFTLDDSEHDIGGYLSH